MNTIEKAIDEQFDQHAKLVARLNSLREVGHMTEAGVAKFGGTVYVMLGGFGILSCVRWSIGVTDFREALPILEFIEAWRPAGLVCTKTRDSPEDYMRQRAFDFDGRFTLSCTLNADSTACRAVLKGYKQEPIYEFECAEQG